MMTTQSIEALQNEYIREYYKCVETVLKTQQKNQEIFFVYLKGSQNYNLDTPSSDIDIVAITIPSLNEVLCCGRPCNRDVLMLEYPFCEVLDSTKGICSFMDVRNYFNALRKGTPIILESLFTDIYAVNPKYREYFVTLRAAANDIVRMNPKGVVMSLIGGATAEYDKIISKKDSITPNYHITNKAKASFLRQSIMKNRYLFSYDTEAFDYKTLLTFSNDLYWHRTICYIKNTTDRDCIEYDKKIEQMATRNREIQWEWIGKELPVNTNTSVFLESTLCSLFKWSL